MSTIFELEAAHEKASLKYWKHRSRNYWKMRRKGYLWPNLKHNTRSFPEGRSSKVLDTLLSLYYFSSKYEEQYPKAYKAKGITLLPWETTGL